MGVRILTCHSSHHSLLCFPRPPDRSLRLPARNRKIKANSLSNPSHSSQQLPFRVHVVPATRYNLFYAPNLRSYPGNLLPQSLQLHMLSCYSGRCRARVEFVLRFALNGFAIPFMLMIKLPDCAKVPLVLNESLGCQAAPITSDLRALLATVIIS